MSHIHVCLVSDQPIPNLTTVIQFRPDKVVLLSTKDKAAQAERLEGVMRKYCGRVESREILPYEISDVMAVSESLMDEHDESEVTLNITGGTKIAAMGAFQSFFTRGKAIYYVNTRDNEIIRIYPEADSIPIDVSIPIEDYLSAYGFRTEQYVKDDGYVYRRKGVTNFLAVLAREHEKLIGSINYLVNKAIPDPDKASYPIDVEFPRKSRIKELCEKLNSCGVAEQVGKTTIRISSQDAARYLQGIWFEEYVYMIAKSLPVDEVRMGVAGQWAVPGRKPLTNEFDVMIAKKNRLFYISCKTSDPDRKKGDSLESVSKEYLYELDSLGDMAVGIFGKRMLVSARTIRNEYVRKRARVLNIDLVDGRNVLTLKDKLLMWLS